MTEMSGPTPNPRHILGTPEMRQLVLRIARRRVPEADVEDLVQTVLCDAIASRNIPDNPGDVRRWLAGITRHKIADHYRQRSRAKHVPLPDQLPAAPSPHEARELARWADKQIAGNREAKRTLAWMAREGSGEKLAHIAEDEHLPPAQVRQRVSRLRRLMRQRWVAELAAVAGVGAAILLAWYLVRKPAQIARPLPVPAPEIIPPTHVDPRIAEASDLRQGVLTTCNTCSDHQSCHRCLSILDQAAQLDPAGDKAKPVQAARSHARKALSLPDPDSTPNLAPAPSASPPKPPKSSIPVPSKTSRRPSKPSPKLTPKQKPSSKKSRRRKAASIDNLPSAPSQNSKSTKNEASKNHMQSKKRR